jgi:hypothetical protein
VRSQESSLAGTPLMRLYALITVHGSASRHHDLERPEIDLP